MEEVLTAKVEANTHRIRYIGAACLLLFVLMLLAPLALHTTDFPMGLLPLATLTLLGAVYTFIYSASLRLDRSSLEARFPYGTYHIKWREIESVEMAGGNLVLAGRHKRLTLPAFEFWGGRDRQQAVRMVTEILAACNPRPETSFKTLLPLYENTRIP